MDGRDRMQYTTRDQSTTVVLTGTYMKCTRCGELKPASAVGLREIAGGIRNQPQCTRCRSLKPGQLPVPDNQLALGV
jgi:hypothetical protein